MQTVVTDAPKNLGGRPPYVPTEDDRAKVRAFARVGIAHEAIARAMQISPTTLRKHFREILDNEEIEANAAVGGALYSRALAGSDTAAIWWTKARMGWSETIKNQHEGHVGIEFIMHLAGEQPAVIDAAPVAKQIEEPEDE